MDKRIMALCLLAIILCNAAYADGSSWLDFLDEATKESLLQDKEAVAAFDATTAGEPLFVKDMNAGKDYYLVPFNKNGSTTGVLMIDSAQGYFRQAAWMQQPTKYLPVSGKEAMQKVKSTINPKPTQDLAIVFYYGEEKAELQWQQGEYSQSPFKPFWAIQINIGQWIIDQKGNFYEITAFNSNNADTNISEINENPPNSGGFTTFGKYYEIVNPDLNNGEFSATLTFFYNDEDNDGIVDGTQIKEQELNVYYYGEGNGWTEITEPIRNTEENTISVTVNHFTLFALMAKKPAPEPEPQPEPQPPAASGGGSFGGSWGGSGSGAKLIVNISGNCVNQPVNVSILNESGKPAPDVKVTAVKDRKTLEEKKTGFEGKATFVFMQAGTHQITATKTNYTANTQTIEITECKEQPKPECENKCNDKNPCTKDECTEKGCSHETLAKGTKCGENKECAYGKCTAIENKNQGQEMLVQKENASTSQTGFAALNQNNALAALGALAALAAIAGIALHLKKKKK